MFNSSIGFSGNGASGGIAVAKYATFAAFKAATVANPSATIEAIVTADETNGNNPTAYKFINGVIYYTELTATAQ